ncbi:hypothetical protein GOV11_03490 [Candidatus Woesearchaeota archaeon]|nr:hypothetical protein [Candidatus Woesearchaeota archaeon]
MVKNIRRISRGAVDMYLVGNSMSKVSEVVGCSEGALYKWKIANSLKGKKRGLMRTGWRRKISESLKGIKRSQEFKNKLRVARTGRNHSVYSIEKMRLAHIGKKHSDAMKSKMSRDRKGKVFCPMSRSEETRAKCRVNLCWCCRYEMVCILESEVDSLSVEEVKLWLNDL